MEMQARSADPYGFVSVGIRASLLRRYHGSQISAKVWSMSSFSWLQDFLHVCGV